MNKTNNRNREGRLMVVVGEGTNECVSDPRLRHTHMVAVYDPTDSRQRAMARSLYGHGVRVKAVVESKQAPFEYGQTLAHKYDLGGASHNFAGLWVMGAYVGGADRVLEGLPSTGHRTMIFKEIGEAA